jgi:hypothetical protein
MPKKIENQAWPPLFEKKKKKTKSIIRPMQVTCYFSLITQKGGWLGASLKLPQKIPRLQRDPCLHPGVPVF